MGPKAITVGAVALILCTASAGVLLVDVIHQTLHANVLTNALFVGTGTAILAWLSTVHCEAGNATVREQHASGRLRDLKSTTSSSHEN
jgi:hypothetical protein